MSEFRDNFGPLGLIDVAFEDDCLYSTSSPPRDFNFSDDLFDAGDPLSLNIIDSPSPQTSIGGDDVREPDERKQNVKCNLRTSLAWDSAFHNGAGVLEPDELSSIAGQAEKRGMLPGIREEFKRSTDSLSTLESDGLTMDNLEGDLFGDIRASIQKSNRSSAVATKSMTKSPRMGSGMAASRMKQSPKTVEEASPTKPKANAALKKTATVIPGSRRMSKPASPGTQAPQSPKIAGRVSISAAAKGPSSNRNRVQLEDDKGKGSASANAKAPTGTIKPPASGGPRNTVSSLRPLFRSSSSSMKTESVASSSSNRSESISSDGSIKSLKSGRRNVAPRTGVPSSSLIAKATSRITSKSKNLSTIPHPFPYLKSAAAKLSSPSISPASSVSEWSLESVSFSPTSPLNKRSNYSRSSIGSSSCGDRYEDDCSSQVSDSQSHSSENSAVTGTVFNERRGLHSDMAKPSSLRLPSPKIGFFDGGRSSALKSNGNVQPQPGAPSGIPRPGTVVQGKLGLGKVQNAKTTTPVKSPKIITQKQSLSSKSKSPLSHSDSSSTAVPKVGSISRSAKRSPGISPRVQSKTSPTDKTLKPMKVTPIDERL